jgi:hypothetical protein
MSRWRRLISGFGVLNVVWTPSYEHLVGEDAERVHV